MTRRYRKSSSENTFDELVRASSVLPWWLSVGLAVLLFLFVPFSIAEPNGSFSASDVSGLLVGVIFSIAFKYFVPLALVLGGVINLFKRGKSAWMFSSISKRGAKETLRNLSWKDFEFLVSEYYKRQGYRIDLIDAQGADGGVDIKIYKDNSLFLVQCKHYKSWKVSVQIVRELYGVMTAENAQGGFLITTGKFTKDAVSFAEDKEIQLIDGNQLEMMLEDNLDTISVKNTDDEISICPRCGNKLLNRKGPRGEFIGCSSFPKCRYTADLV